MNRETKIGLLTGLGVIILIGVLLSQYLGGPDTSPRSANLTSLGDTYRQHQLQPVAADPAIKPEGTMLAGVDNSGLGRATPNAGGADPLIARLPTRDGPATVPPTANNPITMPPLISEPVAPQPMGPVVAAPNSDPTAIPPVQINPGAGNNGLARAIYVPADPNTPAPVVPADPLAAMPTGTFYTVAKGDSLSAIAQRFYKSASKANFSRIVAANPKVLKNEKTGLQVGMKLLIPDAPKTVAVANSSPVMPPLGNVPPTAPETLVLRPDTGNPAPVHSASPGLTARTLETVKPVATTYKVQAGDTLAKIAKKFLGSSGNPAIRKIMTANKLKDDYLDVGMTLRIPAKAAA